MRQELAQLVFLFVVHVEESDHTASRRLYLILDLLIDGASVVVAAHDERIEPDLLATDARNHRGSDDEPWDVGDDKLKCEQRDKRLVIRLVVSHLIIKDDDKEKDHGPQQSDKEGLTQFFQARLVVHFLIGPRHRMENQPTDGNDDYTNPKTRRHERMRDAVPIIDVKVFVRLAEEIKQSPRQNGRNPIDDEIQRCQPFLIHNER